MKRSRPASLITYLRNCRCLPASEHDRRVSGNRENEWGPPGPACFGRALLKATFFDRPRRERERSKKRRRKKKSRSSERADGSERAGG
ncbi:hypothetical protein MTO96_007598 [Rhipicephalus appendiculatus]